MRHLGRWALAALLWLLWCLAWLVGTLVLFGALLVAAVSEGYHAGRRKIE